MILLQTLQHLWSYVIKTSGRLRFYSLIDLIFIVGFRNLLLWFEFFDYFLGIAVVAQQLHEEFRSIWSHSPQLNYGEANQRQCRFVYGQLHTQQFVQGMVYHNVLEPNEHFSSRLLILAWNQRFPFWFFLLFVGIVDGETNFDELIEELLDYLLVGHLVDNFADERCYLRCEHCVIELHFGAYVQQKQCVLQLKLFRVSHHRQQLNMKLVDFNSLLILGVSIGKALQQHPQRNFRKLLDYRAQVQEVQLALF